MCAARRRGRLGRDGLSGRWRRIKSHDPRLFRSDVDRRFGGRGRGLMPPALVIF